jgi:hypothetical protein
LDISYYFFTLDAGIAFGKQNDLTWPYMTLDDEGTSFCIMKSMGVT